MCWAAWHIFTAEEVFLGFSQTAGKNAVRALGEAWVPAFCVRMVRA